MKLQFLPLALYFLFSVFMSSHPLFASEEGANLLIENIDNETTTTAFSSLYPFQKEAETTPVQNQSIQTQTAAPTALTASPYLSKNAEVEENSYKIKDGNQAVGEKNSEKIKAEIKYAKVDLHLFNKGLFYGFVIMVIILNLVCFFIFEERSFLFYSAAIISIGSVMFYDDGLFALIGFNTFLNATALHTSLLLFAVGCTILFSFRYLNVEEFFPKLKYITYFAFSSATVMVFTTWLTDENAVVAQVTTVLLFGIMCTYFATGILLFKKKNYAKFFVFAYTIPMLLAIDYFLLEPLGIPFLLSNTAYIKFAAIAEMLLLTYAIIYRMKALKEESILRQTEMRIFLQRQEVHNRQNIEKLMEDTYLENLIMHYDLDGLEVKLLQYISEGKENEKIARKLKMSVEDVEELTKDLYHKLEIQVQIKDDYRMLDNQPDYLYN